MDDADRSGERMDAEMEAFQRKRRATFIAPEPTYHRFCLYCSDDTENGRPYCCEDCKLDDIRLKQSKQRNGNPR